MNNLKKLFVAICFSLAVSTVIFTVGTSRGDVWASNETSNQMKSNVGITFTEDDSEQEEEQSKNTDNSAGKDNSQSNNAEKDRKKGILPSTGEKRTMLFGVIGVSICGSILYFYKKRNNQ